MCHALRGRVSRNFEKDDGGEDVTSHALRGRVSRNLPSISTIPVTIRHALRGRVSRNHLVVQAQTGKDVTPYAGV